MAAYAILAANDFVGLPEPFDQFAFVHFQNVVANAPSATSARGFTASLRPLSFGNASARKTLALHHFVRNRGINRRSAELAARTVRDSQEKARSARSLSEPPSTADPIMARHASVLSNVGRRVVALMLVKTFRLFDLQGLHAGAEPQNDVSQPGHGSRWFFRDPASLASGSS